MAMTSRLWQHSKPSHPGRKSLNMTECGAPNPSGFIHMEGAWCELRGRLIDRGATAGEQSSPE
jgi:hypothetical protein